MNRSRMMLNSMKDVYCNEECLCMKTSSTMDVKQTPELKSKPIKRLGDMMHWPRL